MSNYYIVKNVITGKISASMIWNTGKVDAVHLFTNRRAAREQARRLNTDYGNHRNNWRIRTVTVDYI